MTRDGWNCPKCGKAHAPHVITCPEQIVENDEGAEAPPKMTRVLWDDGHHGYIVLPEVAEADPLLVVDSDRTARFEGRDYRVASINSYEEHGVLTVSVAGIRK